MIIKAVSGLVVICMVRVARSLRVVSGMVAALLPRSTRRRLFVDSPQDLVDGATYEFLHDGGSTCVRIFFTDHYRAMLHATDSFTLSANYGYPGLKSFQKHLPSGERLPPGTGAWHNACNFFGPLRTARIKLVSENRR